MAAQAGLAPAPSRLTGGRTTVIRLSNKVGQASRLSYLKLVSAAGIAPAFPRSQAECIGCYATRCDPGVAVVRRGGERGTLNPGSGPAVRFLKFRMQNAKCKIWLIVCPFC